MGVLSHFRVQREDCLCTRADALLELTDAVVGSDGPVTSPIELTRAAQHGRARCGSTARDGHRPSLSGLQPLAQTMSALRRNSWITTIPPTIIAARDGHLLPVPAGAVVPVTATITAAGPSTPSQRLT